MRTNKKNGRRLRRKRTKIYLYFPPRKWHIFGFVDIKLPIFFLEVHG
jgi:hypothetical protein